MSTLKELQSELVEHQNQYEIDVRVIRRRINAQMRNETEEQVANILNNYNMGMLTLHEMTGQMIEAWNYLHDNAYRTDQVE